MNSTSTTTTIKPRGAWRRIWRWTWRLSLSWLLLTWLVVLLLRFVPPVTSAFMLGRWIHAHTAGERDFHLRYQWIPWQQAGNELPIALVASEDQKFPIHHGFDVQAIQEALDEADAGEKLRGASTISQQVAKNLFLWGGRSFMRKGLEGYFTVLIELCWPKRRILEMYLNVAEFGDGIYGAEAASHVYFHKPASALSAHEAALLTALLPNPRHYHIDPPTPYVLRHAAWVERQVHQLGGPAYLEH